MNCKIKACWCYFCCIIGILLFVSVCAYAQPVFKQEPPTERVYVAQSLPDFSKKYHVDVTLSLWLNLISLYHQSVAPWLNVVFYPHEWIGIEASGAYYFAWSTQTVRDLQQYEYKRPRFVELKVPAYSVGLSFLFTPLKGKLALLSTTLGYYSLYVLAGPVLVGTRVPCQVLSLNDNDPLTCQSPQPRTWLFDGIRPGVQMGIGMRLLFKSYVGIKLEIRDILYPDHLARVTQFKFPSMRIESSFVIQNQVSFLMGVVWVF